MTAYSWAPYQSATGCTKYGPAGCQAMMVYLEDIFPGQVSMGICNCRDIAGTSSWSHHAECRAYDEGFAVFTGQRIGIRTLEILGPHGARLGIDHMIVNHDPGASDRGDPRVYSARSPQGRVYTGAHPHKNHNHIGLTRSAGRNLTYATLVVVAGHPSTHREGEAVLHGIDIGKTGDDSLGPKPEYGVLQAFLIRQGQDIGAWGPNKDGVDRRPGDDTRRGLHNWKVSVGITSALSAGEGKIGDYEMAAIYSAGGAAAAPDLSGLATKADLAAHAKAKASGTVHPHAHDEGRTGGPL